MNRLFNKTTILYAMLGICLGIITISTIVWGLESLVMFIGGVLTGMLIFQIDEENAKNEPA